MTTPDSAAADFVVLALPGCHPAPAGSSGSAFGRLRPQAVTGGEPGGAAVHPAPARGWLDGCGAVPTPLPRLVLARQDLWPYYRGWRRTTVGE